MFENEKMYKQYIEGMDQYIQELTELKKGDPEKAKAQAKEFKHSLETELVRLSLHSILHCLGYDHIKDEDYVVMHKVEQEVGALCGYNFSE